MTGRVTRVAGLLALLALASASAGASEAARPPVALVASPAHVDITVVRLDPVMSTCA